MSNSPITQVGQSPGLPSSIITQVSQDPGSPGIKQTPAPRSSDRPPTSNTNPPPAKPDSVKSPRTPTSNKSRKAGFLSLFSCCTWGADGFLDGSKDANVKLGPLSGKGKQTPSDDRNAQIANTGQGSTTINGNEAPVADSDMAGSSGAGAAGPATAPGTPEIEPIRLLGPICAEDEGRKCLVLDLDETLVHSSFKIIHQADYIVPVEIENQIHNVYVIKRPGVDEFLKRMGDLYEIVVFTASLSKYADPVLNMLDIHRVVRHRLFRESCYNHKGNYVKDLSQIGRDLKQTIIIDNSPASYIFHVNNAVPISSWFNDPHDTELLDLIPFLNDLTGVPDVTMVLDTSNMPPGTAEGA